MFISSLTRFNKYFNHLFFNSNIHKFAKLFKFVKFQIYKNSKTSTNATKSGLWPLQQQQIRHCFHPGPAYSSENIGNINAPAVTSTQMLRAMMAYIWPKDNDFIRKR